jgi:serine/threonine protein kinase
LDLPLTSRFPDRTGAPRPVVNSRGRRRRAGTKTLAQVLRCDEENFIDFIAKCLHWDPERRLKPQNALRHPFITAGRRRPLPVTSMAPSSSRSLLASSSSSRVKASTLETPRKTQIGAPTPLAARASGNRLAPGPSVPATPITSTASMHVLSSSMSQSARHRSSYRTDASSGISYHHSSRTLANGYAVSKFRPALLASSEAASRPHQPRRNRWSKDQTVQAIVKFLLWLHLHGYQNRTERYLAHAFFPLTIKTWVVLQQSSCLRSRVIDFRFHTSHVSATLFACHFIFSLTLTCHLGCSVVCWADVFSIFLANSHRCTRLAATIPSLPCPLYHATP